MGKNATNLNMHFLSIEESLLQLNVLLHGIVQEDEICLSLSILRNIARVNETRRPYYAHQLLLTGPLSRRLRPVASKPTLAHLIQAKLGQLWVV